MKKNLIYKIGLLLAAFILPVSAVHAYVGPGAGITAIGSLIAFCACLLVAIIGFIWFPLRRILRKKKDNDDEPESDFDSPSDDSDKNQ